jgi:ubiquinone/menaquinone biosynthesis C-methylase UbiE
VGIWSEQVVPRFANLTLATAEVRRFRQEVVAGLSGEVLEIGFGSGLNVALYPPEVTAVLAVEPSHVARRLAAPRLAAAPVVAVDFVALEAEQLPLGDDSIDAALSTFTLCTIPDVTQALRELRRVLKPGGHLHFLEHGLSPSETVARWQHRLTPLQRRLAGGCHLDRPIDRLLAEAGFELTSARNDQMRGPRVLKPFSYLYLGEATKAA